MTAKKYLRGLQRLDTMIDQKLNELASLKATLTTIGGIDYSKDRVQTSRSQEAPFEKTIARIVDLNAEIDREIDSFVDRKHTIINQIQGLENTTYVEILYKRYVEYKRLEMISVEMNLTYQYVRELHGKALQAFESSYINLH